MVTAFCSAGVKGTVVVDGVGEGESEPDARPAGAGLPPLTASTTTPTATRATTIAPATTGHLERWPLPPDSHPVDFGPAPLGRRALGGIVPSTVGEAARANCAMALTRRPTSYVQRASLTSSAWSRASRRKLSGNSSEAGIAAPCTRTGMTRTP